MIVSVLVVSVKEILENSVVLAIIGGIVAGLGWWLKDTIPNLIKFLSKFIISSLEVDTRDKVMFETIISYLDSFNHMNKVNQFSVRMLRNNDDWQDFSNDIQQNLVPQIVLSPAPGFHILKINGKWMWLTRKIEVSQQIMETIVVSCFGTNKEHLVTFINHAVDYRISKELDKIAIYIPSISQYADNQWQRAKLGNLRRLKSVILKEGQAESIFKDLEMFYESKMRYEELGIAWRRGYLLYGSPGTGKTSLVTALACELRLNVCTISLASSGIDDDKINALLSGVPPRSLILIEDVDAFFIERSQQSQQIKITFSGFLNALDGIATHEGSVVFLTTNHPEKLDPALVRSGRIDYKIELGVCDEYQIKKMFIKFFDNEEVLAEKFSKELYQKNQNLTPAYLQEKLLLAKTPQEAFVEFNILA